MAKLQARPSDKTLELLRFMEIECAYCLKHHPFNRYIHQYNLRFKEYTLTCPACKHHMILTITTELKEE